MNKPMTETGVMRLSGAYLGRSHILDGSFLDIINPATEAPICQLLEVSADQVKIAVNLARVSFENGEWSQASYAERASVLKRVAILIREEAGTLARLDTLTTGLPYHRSTLRQTQAAAGWFDFFADCLEEAQDEHFYADGFNTVVTREPAGVCALFTPWNIPLMAAGLKLGAALAMGNSCIVKPSEQSPLGTEKLVGLLCKAGLPDNVVSLVNGRGAVTGAALAASKQIDRFSFTGGKIGAKLGARITENLGKVTLELGGKSANIIFADCDYDRALDGALLSAFGNNGQACLAGSRILVESSIADRFLSDFVTRAKSIKIGDPFDADTEMGPISSKLHRDHILSFLDKAAEDGGEILCGETGPRNNTLGYYIDPIVVRAKSNADRICQEEIFGPFAAVLIFDNEDEAVSIANDSPFGLAGYVWSKDQDKAQRVAQALRTGTVVINSSFLREKRAPFGGYGESGIDREGGRWSLDFYSEAKTIVTPNRIMDIPRSGERS